MSTIIGTGPEGPAGNGGQPAAGLIKDSNIEGFAADVIDASMSAPVIVDFWAPWCGPCKQLTPALEKAVTAARGAVRMVKVNIDENQELAAQMRIQSVPAVYAFHQGRPVDGFVGALPESQITSFVDRLIEAAGTGKGPDPLAQALEQAQSALELGQHGAASALFMQILQHEPENLVATAGVIRCTLEDGDAESAQAMFDGLSEEMRASEELASIAASLELAALGGAAGDIAGLMEKVAENHDDHQARFDLAMALYGSGKQGAAADELLEIIRRNRSWNDEAARKQLLKFFEAWGPTDPLTLETRRQLSALLFS
jgi:putative thioredoxin